DSGKSACKYSFIENATYIMFYDSFSSTHKQIFDRMLKGNYEIFVKCEDIAENTAEQKTEFKLEIDITPPEIIRIYSTGSLNVITDEDSECVYTNSNCLFPWSNSTKMAGIQKSHTTDLQQGKTYYIKCMDIWGNKPDSCSIILKTS
ncbi:MAG: hypothetical protein KJ559_01375, partial [Nanoarchaeota archaeon]|nr:hypothetical protein [Nanoarchaeota archaeon]